MEFRNFMGSDKAAPKQRQAVAPINHIIRSSTRRCGKVKWVGIDIGQKRHGAVIFDTDTKQIVACSVFYRPTDIINYISQFIQPDEPFTVFYEVPTPYGQSATSLFITAANLGATLVTISSKFPCVSFKFFPRPYIKLILLGTVKGKDKDIRDFLKNWWSNKLVGVRIKADAWAALAVLTAALIEPTEPDYEVVRMWREFAEVWRPFSSHTEALDSMQKLLMEVTNDAQDSSRLGHNS
jgi:hypothetical protein